MEKSEILSSIVKSEYAASDVVKFCIDRGFYGSVRIKKGAIKTVKTRKDIQNLRFCYLLLEPVCKTKSGKESPRLIGEVLSIQYQTVYAGVKQIDYHLKTEEGQKEFTDFCQEFESYLKSRCAKEEVILHEGSDTVISDL